jgi:PAS domain S-box-containing protein
MLRTSSRRFRDETTYFLVGLVALASLTGLGAWLGFRPVPAALVFLILIVLLSLVGSFVGAIALSFLALGSFAYFFAPQILHLDYLEDIITVMAFLLTSLIVTSLVRQLRARRDELANALHAMPALVWHSSSTGMADFSNQRFCDYTGLSFDALGGWGWMKTLHSEDSGVEWWHATLASGAPFEREVRIRSAAGEYRWFMLRMTPLRNDVGTIIRWCAAASDVEERRRAEQALRRSEAYLEEAQRLSHTGSWAYDMASRRLIYCSEENFRLFGYDPAGGLPSNADWSARIHTEDREAAFATMRQRIEERSGYEVDYRVIHPDGTMKYLRSVAHPVFGPSGGVIEVVGTHIDVTERKQAEEARLDAQHKLAHANRVATMGQLTASIAHEVNQPVGALVTNAHAALRLLRMQPPDLDQASQALDDIIRDGRRVGDVIERIRAWVKNKPLDRQPVDINDLITETIALTRGEMVKGRIVLETRLAGHVPPVRGDRVQLQQVIMNLVMNAVEAMGTVDALPRRLQIATSTDPDNDVVVTVRDSGQILKLECVERFFEAFYSTKSSGMGIGLSICRSIVEAHDGRIWVTPNIDNGATLHVSLPIWRHDGSCSGAHADAVPIPGDGAGEHGQSTKIGSVLGRLSI